MHLLLQHTSIITYTTYYLLNITFHIQHRYQLEVKLKKKISKIFNLLPEIKYI